MDEVDDIMADLGLGPAGGGAGATQEVDDIMAELGLGGGGGGAPSNTYGEMPMKPATTGEDEVDALLADIGIGATTPMSSGPGAGMSSGPGRGRGMSSGPGRAGMSSGPGLRAGMSSGPGKRGGMSSGPGRGRGRGAAEQPKMATHTPDGREIKHTGPPCAYCEKTIIGSCTNALGKQYHPECFVCVTCAKPFPDGEFLDHEEKPYCEECYNDVFSARCDACGQPIEDKCISVADKKYHPEHFTCLGCGDNLSGKKFKEEDGDVFCTKCMSKRQRRVPANASICGMCKKPIVGEYITLKGQRVHPHHYTCEECGCAFTGGNCHEYEGRLYCYEDYLKQLKDICSFCHKPIIGRSFTAMGRVWHPEHFVCYHCKEPFHGTQFMEKDGNPYCELHWYQLFGSICAKCNLPVVGQVIRALGKPFHPACFTCYGCDSALGGQIYEYESKSMCEKCYKKLPKDVRKQLEKKKKEKAKAEKARQKANN